MNAPNYNSARASRKDDDAMKDTTKDGSTFTNGTCLLESETMLNNVQTKNGSTSTDGGCLLDTEGLKPDGAFLLDTEESKPLEGTVNHNVINDHCSFEAACHVFKSMGNSSQMSRFVKDFSINCCNPDPIIFSRYKKRRRKKKQSKIAKLPTVSDVVFGNYNG